MAQHQNCTATVDQRPTVLFLNPSIAGRLFSWSLDRKPTKTWPIKQSQTLHETLSSNPPVRLLLLHLVRRVNTRGWLGEFILSGNSVRKTDSARLPTGTRNRSKLIPI